MFVTPLGTKGQTFKKKKKTEVLALQLIFGLNISLRCIGLIVCLCHPLRHKYIKESYRAGCSLFL